MGEIERYQELYDNFIKDYKAGVQFSADQIGFIYAQLAQCFGEKNLLIAIRADAKSKKAVEIANSLDDKGKTISAAKTDILLNATDEYKYYDLAKRHQENIGRYLDAMKIMQYGAAKEWKQE